MTVIICESGQEPLPLLVCHRSDDVQGRVNLVHTQFTPSVLPPLGHRPTERPTLTGGVLSNNPTAKPAFAPHAQFLIRNRSSCSRRLTGTLRSPHDRDARYSCATSE